MKVDRANSHTRCMYFLNYVRYVQVKDLCRQNYSVKEKANVCCSLTEMQSLRPVSTVSKTISSSRDHSIILAFRSYLSGMSAKITHQWQKTFPKSRLTLSFSRYLLMQIPSNMLMSSKHVRPSLYMAVCMMGWAIVSACTALAKNYTDLVVVRFFLGVAEAPFYPGAIYMLSIFYTRKEIATRLSILYSGNIFATSFSGLIAAAVFNTIDGNQGLKGWQWLFIIEGCLTFGIAIIGIFTLADNPLTTRWLKPEERQLAHDRMVKDTVGLTESKGARAGFKQAIRDPRLWLLCFIQNMHLSACGFNNFFPTVVGSLGFNETITLVLTCPPYLVSGFFGYFAGLSSGKYNERTWHITGCMGMAIVGFVISCATLNTAARYISCFLFASGAYAVNSMVCEFDKSVYFGTGF